MRYTKGLIAGAAIAGLTACKGNGEHVECGPGTTLRDHTCVAAAEPPPPPPDAAGPEEPGCEDLCAQLVACEPPTTPGHDTFDDGHRIPLDVAYCNARCTDGWRPRDPMSLHGGREPRPDCSKGCDSPACVRAYDWASEPPYVPPGPKDPVSVKVVFEPRQDSAPPDLLLTLEVVDKTHGDLALVAVFWICATNHFETTTGWIRTGVSRKQTRVPVVLPRSCSMGWATLQGVKFVKADLGGPGEIWRPGWAFEKPLGAISP